jgi:ABC-2 type transport system permease protein
MRHLALLGHYFVQYTKVRLAFRGDFAISIFTTTLATVFGVLTVYLIFGRTGGIRGWTFDELLFLYGFSLAPLALFNMVSINLYYFSEHYLVEGKFDRVLLRPVHSLFQIVFEQFRLEALGDVALGLFLMIRTARRIDPPVEAAEWAFLAFAAVCGALIYLAVFLTLTCVSFWMEDRVGVIPPVYNMIAFGRYPLDIYHGFLRFLLSWILPFAFAGFYPAAAVLREEAYRSYAIALPLVAAAAMTIAIAVWNRGVRNYSSTGS